MQRRAFTLVELLVVIAIIAALSAMLVAAAGGAQEGAKIKQTESLLVKVDAAVEQFIVRFKTPPVPTWSGYEGGNDGTQLDNKLFWRLGSDMTVADRDAAEAEIQAAIPAIHAGVTTADVEQYRVGMDLNTWHTWGSGGNDYQRAYMEILKMARVDLASAEIMRTAQRMDLLSVDDIGQAFIADAPDGTPNAMLIDSWGQPLVYASIYAPEVKNRNVEDANPITGQSCQAYRAPSLVGFPASGRSTITAATADTSDIRFTAYPGFELSYELWSAGPDGAFHPQRGHTDNNDNIAAAPYRKEFGE